jgi:YesN/AraC family two-component response regulator
MADYKLVGNEWTKKGFAYLQDRIYYVTEGSATIEMKDGCVSLLPGNLYLLPAFNVEKTTCLDKLGHYYVHFQADWIMNMNQMIYGNTIAQVKANEQDVIERLFSTIINCYQINEVSASLKSIGALQLLMSLFFEDIPAYDYKYHRFIEVIKHIDRHYKSNLKIEKLADIMNLEPVYFSNLFSKTFGIPPRQYIIRKRLQRSQKLLALSELKIKEISEAIGFDNEMYFSRLFHSKIGMTPRQYRIASRENGVGGMVRSDQ